MTILEEIKRIRTAKQDVRQIWEEINESIQDEATLAALNSPSLYAIWRLWSLLMATVIWSQKIIWSTKEKDLQKLVDSNVAMNDHFIAAKLLEYQHGDVYELDEQYRPYYPVIDQSKNVIKHVAVEKQATGFVQPKIIGQDDEGNLVSLSSEVTEGATTFIDAWITGWNGLVLSSEPDLVNYNLNVYYDPIRDKIDVQVETEAAILDYHLSLIQVEGGLWRESGLKSAILSVGMVKDVEDVSIAFRSDSGDYAPADRVYRTFSGYLQIDPLHPLSEGINYIAEE